MALTRRELMGGLLVSAVATRVLADEPSGANQKRANTADPQAAAGLKPNLFVHVGNDGRVTIACHRSEMGQGVRSTLPVLIADELGARTTTPSGTARSRSPSQSSRTRRESCRCRSRMR